MEIGSFIELEFPKGKEYYKGDVDIARLNTGRAAIYHAFRITGCKRIWLPYYQCETVREFLNKKGIDIAYYHIDSSFNPIDIKQKEDDAILIVNYFGIMSNHRMVSLASNYKNVIVDNSQAFFALPISSCLNVYSCRKFFGVPDGAYVIGKNAHHYLEEYKQGYSSDTSLYLLQRIEYGCEGKAYQSRTVNENRIDSEDIMLMSKLTRNILDSIDYDEVIKLRKKNFAFMCSKLDSTNNLSIERFADNDIVPMVYPYLTYDESIYPRLLNNKHFQGKWWNYILKECSPDSFESILSKNNIPITIDQRYSLATLENLTKIIIQ